MNPVQSRLTTLIRSWPIRSEERGGVSRPAIALAAALVGLVSLGATTIGTAATAVNSTHSTTIALTSDDQRLVVVNREANSVSIIRVKDASGNDVAVKLAEIGVGEEPRCVAIHPNDKVAY